MGFFCSLWLWSVLSNFLSYPNFFFNQLTVNALCVTLGLQDLSLEKESCEFLGFTMVARVLVESLFWIFSSSHSVSFFWPSSIPTASCSNIPPFCQRDDSTWPLLHDIHLTLRKLMQKLPFFMESIKLFIYISWKV